MINIILTTLIIGMVALWLYHLAGFEVRAAQVDARGLIAILIVIFIFTVLYFG